jgi:hypothetical protein
MKHYIHSIKIILFIAVGSIILLLIPLKIPFSIHTRGSLTSAQEWLLTKDQNGRISVSLNNRLHGITEMYGLTQFERQDAIRLYIHPHIRPGALIQAGDTVGIILSHHLERELTQLEGELKVARAMLEVYQAGEKEATIEEARGRLNYARAREQGYRPAFIRAQSLRERNLISEEEYEVALNQIQVYEVETAIAEAQLQRVLTGESQEQIGLVQTQISVLEENVRSLKQQKQDFSLIVPITGIVYDTHSVDTIVMIGASDNYVLVAPIPLYQRAYVKEGMRVRLNNSLNNSSNEATVRSVGNRVYFVNGTQLVMTTVSVDDAEDWYIPGIVLSCSIETQPVTLREYVFRYIKPLFQW